MKINKETILKQIIARKSIEYAAKDLGINTPEVYFCNQNIFPNEHITSMFLPGEYAIIIGERWLTESNIQDIIMTSFHEIRHAYQMNQIKKYNEGKKTREKQETVCVWKKEFAKYCQPKSQFKEDEYISQDIEKDAVHYSKKLASEMIL